jgi:hypothetical protein
MADKWCALSVRKLKDGAWNDFRKAWDVTEYGENHPEWIRQIFHVRSVEDPNMIISWGLAEGDADEIKAFMSDAKWRDIDAKRQAAMAPYVKETIVDGVFEVIDEIVPAHV